MAQFTNAEKAKEIKDELWWRQRVYAKRVALHKMTREEAARKLAIMQEIMEDYEAKCSVTDMQEEMFGC